MERVHALGRGFFMSASQTFGPAAAARKPAPVFWSTLTDRTAGMKYKTFQSKTIHGEVSYMIYLPPDYEQRTTVRYPVIYSLHGSGGLPSGGADIAKRLDAAIRGGRVSPMIIVFVNGLRGETMYCDSKDGKFPLETVVMKDLIPHIDATYRTVTSREGEPWRFSMAAWRGTLRLKYPEVFGVVSLMAPALLSPDLKAQTPSPVGDVIQGSDGEHTGYYHANVRSRWFGTPKCSGTIHIGSWLTSNPKIGLRR